MPAMMLEFPCPGLRLHPFFEMNDISFAGKRSGTEIGVPAPFELWIESVSFSGPK